MNVLVISTSPRTVSNSEALAKEFARGAAESGHSVELVSLRHKLGKCVINDDAPEIVAKMHDADVIAFATPIYYYEMCGQMKTLLDRANPLYDSDYKFTDIYMFTAAADNGEYVPQRAISGLTGWIDCFERAKLAGSVFAGGVNEMGEIKGHKALVEAYEMGKKL